MRIPILSRKSCRTFQNTPNLGEFPFWKIFPVFFSFFEQSEAARSWNKAFFVTFISVTKISNCIFKTSESYISFVLQSRRAFLEELLVVFVFYFAFASFLFDIHLLFHFRFVPKVVSFSFNSSDTESVETARTSKFQFLLRDDLCFAVKMLQFKVYVRFRCRTSHFRLYQNFKFSLNFPFLCFLQN